MRGSIHFWESHPVQPERRAPCAEPVNALRLYDCLRQCQGLTFREVMRRLYWSQSTTNTALVSAEYNGLLLSEDEAGRLYPYEEHA
jgi:hypothetical protein